MSPEETGAAILNRETIDALRQEVERLRAEAEVRRGDLLTERRLRVRAEDSVLRLTVAVDEYEESLEQAERDLAAARATKDMHKERAEEARKQLAEARAESSQYAAAAGRAQGERDLLEARLREVVEALRDVMEYSALLFHPGEDGCVVCDARVRAEAALAAVQPKEEKP